MKIAIAGYGYVGKAVEAYLQQTGATTKIVDPEYYRILGKDLTCGLKVSDTNADGVIICVNTPQAENGQCDVSNVIDVLGDTHAEKPVLIKSTISLEGWKQIKEIFSKILPATNSIGSAIFLSLADLISSWISLINS